MRLRRAVLLGPVTIICLGSFALLINKSAFANPSHFFGWFIGVAPAAVLQALLVVPLGIRSLQQSPDPLPRSRKGIAILLALLSLLALAISAPW